MLQLVVHVLSKKIYIKMNIMANSLYSEIENQLLQQPKTWFVTGVAGFIGSHLACRLLKLNQNVVGIDDLSTGLQSNIDHIDSKAKQSGHWKFLNTNICNPEEYSTDLRKCQFILHQAAIGSVPRSIKEPLVSHTANVEGFVQLINTAKNMPIQKMVYASSSSVYGDHPDLPKIESKVGEVLSPYAATKKINEIYASVYARCYNMPIAGLRYFNVFGPRQNPQGPYAAVIPLWIQSMLEGKPIYINGDGSYSRDFCFVENVIQANILAAFSDEKSNGQVYNIAYGARTTLNELFELIRSGIKARRPALQIPSAIYREFRDGDIAHSHADVSKAVAQLGYSPVTTVRQGLLETINHCIDNKG